MKTFSFSRALAKVGAAFCLGTLCLGALSLSASQAKAETFVVNTVADDVDFGDSNPGDGSCSTGRAFFEVVQDPPPSFRLVEECTLRAAIEESNAFEDENGGADTILFQILEQSGPIVEPSSASKIKPASSHTVHRIVLDGALPNITQTVTINGYNRTDGNFNGTLNTAETGWNGELAIEIDGRGLSANTPVFHVTDAFPDPQTPEPNNGTIIRHLSIFGGGTGIRLSGREERSGSHRVFGCFIGLDAAGALVSGHNAAYGVRIEAPNCVVGTPKPREFELRCVISDNDDSGVSMSSDSGRVSDVYLGVNPAGTAALGSQSIGVHVGFNFIGGQDGFDNNVIEDSLFGGHNISGIRVSPDTGVAIERTRISGNIIGLNATQTAAIPNARGVEILTLYDYTDENQIPTELIFDVIIGIGNFEESFIGGEGNVIAGNEFDGILVNSTIAPNLPFVGSSNISSVAIGGNFIGVSSGGTPFLNGFNGISATFVDTLRVGLVDFFSEEPTFYGNTIAATSNGVYAERVSQLTVERNEIRGNRLNNNPSAINRGVHVVRASNNTEILDNEISGFNSEGVLVENANYVELNGNEIYDNGSHGVHLTGQIFESEIEDNTIGLPQDGNNGDGVRITSTFPIGSASVRPARLFLEGTEISGNSIKFNAGNGIFVGADSQNVEITQNSISANFLLGIDLQRTSGQASGTVTPNDPSPDAPVGGNGTPNFPVLDSVEVNGAQVQLEGSLTSAPDATYRLEFFYNANDDEEGDQFLFAQNVTTNGVGFANFAFTHTASSAISGGSFTATSTRVVELEEGEGDFEPLRVGELYAPTSEFSAPVREAFADLQVTQTVSPSPVQVGSEAVFTITTRNNGPSSATNVILTANLPSNVTFISSSAGTVSSGVLTANLGTIANGNSVVTTIRVRTNSVGNFTNIAEAVSDVRDTNDENNEADATGEAIEGDLEITPDLRITRGKLARIGPYVPGLFNRTRFYGQTLSLRNVGPNFSGPIRIFVRDLPSGAVLQNRTGTENGVPFIQLTPGSDNVFSTGETLKITLRFDSPRATPTFNLSVFAEGLAPAPPLNNGKKRRK